MIKIRLYFIVLIFFLTACFPHEHLSEKKYEDESQVLIYLQPMPQEVSRLRFIIDGITAVREDGLRTPFNLFVNELKGADLTQLQKRLASGWLAEGSYTGISIQFKKAFLQGEEGESSLLVPEEPVVVEYPFKVTRKMAQVLFLSLNAKGAVAADGIRFTPGFSLAVSRKVLTDLTGYVSDSDSDSIIVFDKKAMQVVGMISTGKKPKGMVLDKRRGRAYIAASGDDVVEIIDVSSWSIVGRIRLNFRDEPIDLALTPDGRMLVSVNYGSNTVSLIDAISGFEIRRIGVGKRPISAVVDPSGVRAYIMNSLSNDVSVVDLSQNLISAVIGVEGSPIRGAFNRSGDRLYVISPDSPNLSVIDPGSLIVIDKVFVGMGAVSIKVDIRTGLIMAGKKVDGEISVIDPFSLAVVDSIWIDGNAAFMAIDDDENSLFVTLPDRGTLQKINLTSKRRIAEIEVGEAAYAVVVMGER